MTVGARNEVPSNGKTGAAFDMRRVGPDRELIVDRRADIADVSGTTTTTTAGKRKQRYPLRCVAVVVRDIKLARICHLKCRFAPERLRGSETAGSPRGSDRALHECRGKAALLELSVAGVTVGAVRLVVTTTVGAVSVPVMVSPAFCTNGIDAVATPWICVASVHCPILRWPAHQCWRRCRPPSPSPSACHQ